MQGKSTQLSTGRGNQKFFHNNSVNKKKKYRETDKVSKGIQNF